MHTVVLNLLELPEKENCEYFCHDADETKSSEMWKHTVITFIWRRAAWETQISSILAFYIVCGAASRHQILITLMEFNLDFLLIYFFVIFMSHYEIPNRIHMLTPEHTRCEYGILMSVYWRSCKSWEVVANRLRDHECLDNQSHQKAWVKQKWGIIHSFSNVWDKCSLWSPTLFSKAAITDLKHMVGKSATACASMGDGFSEKNVPFSDRS